MARTLAALPEGSRTTDYISLGVISRTFPLKRVRAVLAATGKASQRERDLPAHVVVYYAIALALYMQCSRWGKTSNAPYVRETRRDRNAEALQVSRFRGLVTPDKSEETRHAATG